jgi:hypothetical protein
MNAIQTALSSARFNRILLWFSVLVFVVGAAALVIALAGGSDKAPVNPEPGFKPTLPAKSVPLRNAQGVTIKTFSQLDPEVRSTIHRFLATAVDMPRNRLGESWATIAPSMKRGYTYKQWKNAKELPVIPYPVENIDRVSYYLDYASTKEILAEVGLFAPQKLGIRPVTFQIALVPVGKPGHKRWLVNYWMPRWSPPLPN